MLCFITRAHVRPKPAQHNSITPGARALARQVSTRPEPPPPAVVRQLQQLPSRRAFSRPRRRSPPAARSPISSNADLVRLFTWPRGPTPRLPSPLWCVVLHRLVYTTLIGAFARFLCLEPRIGYQDNVNVNQCTLTWDYGFG
jgi:hypothetical protein